MSFFDGLDPRYRLILCDVWGVVHNGVELYPGAGNASGNGGTRVDA